MNYGACFDYNTVVGIYCLRGDVSTMFSKPASYGPGRPIGSGCEGNIVVLGTTGQRWHMELRSNHQVTLSLDNPRVEDSQYFSELAELGCLSRWRRLKSRVLVVGRRGELLRAGRFLPTLRRSIPAYKDTGDAQFNSPTTAVHAATYDQPNPLCNTSAQICSTVRRMCLKALTRSNFHG